MNRSLHRAIYAAALVAALCGLVCVPPPARVATASTPVVEAPATPVVGPPAQAPAWPDYWDPAQEINVEESGDPDAPPETLTVNERAVENVLHESHAFAAFPTAKRQYKNDKRVAETMLRHALRYADQRPPVARKTTPGQIRKIVSLFNYTSENVPFCAMGVAFVASMAYCDTSPERISYNGQNDTRTFQKVLPLVRKFYFTPSPSCRIMQNEAKKKRFGQRGSWVARGELAPKRAWLVLFDWKNKRGRGDGIPDHVGIVHAYDARDGSKLRTVEFNTSIRRGSQSNGGAVARKVRNMSDVLGFIKTY